MEYRYGEGQRGILSRGMGWGCIDKPPAEASSLTGPDLGDWEVMHPLSKSSALTSLAVSLGVEQRDEYVVSPLNSCACDNGSSSFHVT